MITFNFFQLYGNIQISAINKMYCYKLIKNGIIHLTAGTGSAAYTTD